MGVIGSWRHGSSVVAVVAVLALGGCGSATRDISGSVYLHEDQVTLTVSVDACSSSTRVEVEESASDVRLHATSDRERNGNDCRDSVDVTLASPLGDRRVVDDSSGEELTVRPFAE